jgi:tRNA/tmRNA/rRNA uracil-C5-methylase (TrmA/RlmC/RlmD family)
MGSVSMSNSYFKFPNDPAWVLDVFCGMGERSARISLKQRWKQVCEFLGVLAD